MKITNENVKNLKSIKNGCIWLVLAEGWCPDGAQLLSVFNKTADESDKFDLKTVLRDENEAFMNLVQTNRVSAIPKLILIDKETGEVSVNWGPRAKGGSEFLKNYKEIHGIVNETAKADLQIWYLQDKRIST